MFRQKKIAKKRTVLFVDDDRVALQTLERGLLDESYNKYFVMSCKDALEILNREKVHVIVTDMLMPDMTGLELIRIARIKYPNITGMIISGYEPDTNLQNAVEQGEVFRLIPKPAWKLGGKFEELVQQALVHSNLQNEHNIVNLKI